VKSNAVVTFDTLLIFKVGEGVELRLAYLATRLAKEDVVIGVRIKRRVEINEIDSSVGNSFRSESQRRLSPKYSRFINSKRFLGPSRTGKLARNDNWMQRHVARRNRGGSFRRNFYRKIDNRATCFVSTEWGHLSALSLLAFFECGKLTNT
jgi:hypothetical protein